jgi:phosphoribosylformylglycinamidine synthase
VFLAKVYVTLKPAVNDPQGLTIQGALQMLGFASVQQVRLGKYLEVHLKEEDRTAAQARVEEMCRKLLANPVIEDYHFELEEVVTQP